MVTSSMCLKIDSLTVEYDGLRILGPITWEPKGRLIGVIGPNGVGKTTLLLAIAGIVKYKGKVAKCDRPAFMPAHPAIDPLARVSDVIAAGLYGVKPDYSHIDNIVSKMGLTALLHRRFGSLSSGEKRLVCISRALARKSRIVLLDEPLSFLDVSNQARVLETLKAYSQGHDAIILVTTHELHYLAYFDQILLLDNGQIAYSGNPAGLEQKILGRVYGVEVEMLRPGIFVPKTLLEGGPSGR